MKQLPAIALTLAALLPATSTAQPGMTEAPPELRAVLLEAVSSSDSFIDRFDAEVWLLDMATRLDPYVADSRERMDILKAVHYEATRAQLTPELVLAVIDIESRFDRFAISRVGARGLMQVMPFWLQELKRPEDNLFDITINLRMGCTILRYYLDKSNGDLRVALARYNGSMGKRKYPDKVFTALSEKWFKH
jgi:soluble lytic murein transglycosylase-like protein